jgi:hypothetical protein
MHPSSRRVARRWVQSRGSECSPRTVSFAWVDPRGQVHEVDDHQKWAGRYVNKRFPDDPYEVDWERYGTDPEYEALVVEHWDFRRNLWKPSFWDWMKTKDPAAYTFFREEYGPSVFLLWEGWVKMTNAYTFAMHRWSALSDATREAVLSVVINCAQESGQDPETLPMLIEEWTDLGMITPSQMTLDYWLIWRGSPGWDAGTRDHLVGADTVHRPSVAEFVSRWGGRDAEARLYEGLAVPGRP